LEPELELEPLELLLEPLLLTVEDYKEIKSLSFTQSRTGVFFFVYFGMKINTEALHRIAIAFQSN